MKKNLFFLITLVLLGLSAKSQLLIKNSTNSKISICFGWFQESSKCMVTQGWYNIEPGQTIKPGMNFTSNVDSFYYYATSKEVSWKGEYELLTQPSPSFKISFADKQKTKNENQIYDWTLFKKKTVHFGPNDKKTYTLLLSDDNSTPNKVDPITATEQNNNKFETEKIFDFKNIKELANFYGSENVKTENAYDSEGNVIGMAAVIYPNTRNELKVNFDSYESKFTFITIRKPNSQWKTPKNIKIGMTLDELIKINGRDILIYGFETDYGGAVTWNGGLLENSKIYLMLTPNNKSAYYNSEKYYQVVGDKEFISSNEIIKGLGLTVSELTMQNSK